MIDIAAEEILSDYADNDPRLREEFLTIIQQESHNLLAMISQLLDVAKLEAQALSLDLELVDMRMLLQEVAAEAKERASERGITVEIEVPEDSVLCTCDHDRIRRVVQTLVHNALRFSEASQVVRVTLTKEAQTSVVEVVDQAPRCGEDVRLEAVNNVPVGGGIISHTSTGFAHGLPISIQLVNAHGGSLSAHRGAAGRNVFTVRLPLEQDPDVLDQHDEPGDVANNEADESLTSGRRSS